MIRDKINHSLLLCYKEWLGNGVFFGRGNFSEFMISVMEILIGLQICIVGNSGLKYSMLLERFEGAISIYMLGSLWIISGLLTITGIVLFYYGYTTANGYGIERFLRFVGSLFSIYMWTFSGITLFPSPFSWTYFCLAISSMRVTTLVWRK